MRLRRERILDVIFDKKRMCIEMKELLEYLQITFQFRMKCNISRNEQGLYAYIELIPQALYDTIPSTTTSILRTPEGSLNDYYESNMLNHIQEIQNEEKWIEQIFFYIMKLPDREKHYIIAKYLANDTDVRIMNELNIKERSLNRIKANSLFHLSLLVPSGVHLKDEMKKNK